MKTYRRNKSRAGSIPNLDAKWRWAVNLMPSAKNTGARWVRDWMGFRARLDFSEKTKISFLYRGLHPGPFSRLPSPYTDYATPALVQQILRQQNASFGGSHSSEVEGSVLLGYGDSSLGSRILAWRPKVEMYMKISFLGKFRNVGIRHPITQCSILLLYTQRLIFVRHIQVDSSIVGGYLD